MIDREKREISKIPSRAFREYPQLFRGANNANIHGSIRYCMNRNMIVQSYKANEKLNNDLCIERSARVGVR